MWRGVISDVDKKKPNGATRPIILPPLANDDARKKNADSEYGHPGDKDFHLNTKDTSEDAQSLGFKKNYSATTGNSQRGSSLFTGLDDEGFGWLNALENTPAGKGKDGSNFAAADEDEFTVLNFSKSDLNDADSSARAAHSEQAAEMRFALQRRLHGHDLAVSDEDFEEEFRGAAAALRADQYGKQKSLASELMPYIAAAFFFAFLTGGGVFYFVAIQAPDAPKPPAEITIHEPVRAPESARTAIAPAVERTASITSETAANLPKKVLPRVSIDVSGKNAARLVQEAPPAPVAAPSAEAVTPAAAAREGLAQDFDVSPPAKATPGTEAERKVGNSVPENRIAAAPVAEPMNRPAEPIPARQEAISTNSLTPVEPEPTRAPPAKVAALAPAPVPAEAPKPIPAPKPSLSISSGQEEALLARGRNTMREGDISGARLLLQYLADLGSATGMYAMGQTYDPAVLASLGVRGLRGDPKIARSWYEKAAKLGNADALAKIGAPAN